MSDKARIPDFPTGGLVEDDGSRLVVNAPCCIISPATLAELPAQASCPNGHPADGAPCVSYKCERDPGVQAPCRLT